MPVIDITDIRFIGTSEYDATVAIAAVEAELDGDMALADTIRADYAEALALAGIA